ncbi:tetratricopeptide repeat protein [Sphingomonas sp.]|uniref:tetratricopeptide repeat protein n=1 Tax=Sphingomonas sp. TaxID=28214 RepID=UPI0031D3212F
MDQDDLSGLLPKPPPPRPARRDAAIAAAMRRFDGVPDAPAAEPERPRAPRWKARWGQIGAFASILLVAVISIPMALETPPGRPPAAQPPAAQPDVRAVERQANAGAPQPVATSAPAPAAPAWKPGAAPSATAATAPAPRTDQAAARGETAQREAPTSGFEEAPLASAAPPAPPAPAPPPPAAPRAPAHVAEAKQSAPAPEPSIVVTGSRVRRPEMASASPVTAAGEANVADGDDIVVSGAKLSRARAAVARRGDWNACTVNDPEQSLRGCRRLVNPAAKGAAGIAAARLADGLALGWRQDWDRAIDAFDQAIALDPKLAFAYLNRGLAHQRNGELARAAADLDLAVRHAPQAARGYYNRSIVRQQRGDAKGATADAKRAARLDPRYEAVLE